MARKQFIATTKPALIDRYLEIVEWARQRYTGANGRLVISKGGHPATYSRIEDAAARRYLFGSRQACQQGRTEMTMHEYPTRGYSLETPSLAETALTGWLATAHFQRLNHRYDVRFSRQGVFVLRDGASVAWHNVPYVAQKVAHKVADFLKSAYGVAA
jgi:hypothetical protein